MRLLLVVCAGVATLALSASGIRAQQLDGARAALTWRPIAETQSARSDSATIPRIAQRETLRPYAALASFVIPGSGQALLHNDRFIAYLAIEAVAWWQYSKDITERSAQERAYKDLARRFARRSFSTTFPDSNWTYYEWMRDKRESGAFSLSSSGPIIPETDTSTFNGFRWFVAQATQPNYAAALAQYEREAIRPEFRWSWRNAQFQYDLYIRQTDLRNDASRAAVKDLLVIAANHFLSMIDAFTTYRLQVLSGPNGRAAIGASLSW